MKRVLFGLTVLFLFAAPAVAQTHPCDLTPPTNPSVQNPYKLQFCSDLKDLDGNVLPPATVQVRVTIDAVPQALRPMPSPIGTPSATGFNLYEIAGFVSPKGNHTIIVGLVNADGEGISAPFGYTVRGKAPKPPTANVVQ